MEGEIKNVKNNITIKTATNLRYLLNESLNCFNNFSTQEFFKCQIERIQVTKNNKNIFFFS